MIRRLLSAAAATAAVLAILAAAAPPSQAQAAVMTGPKACNTDGAPAQLHTTAAVHLRAGRGIGHPSLAVLAKNTDFYAECWGVARDVWWAYGAVESGSLSGRRGWVAGDHLATGYKHP
ncbi:hypothetical protein SAMN05216532_8245 [Streptomyces sp. 2231.1]|uniref:hypothetical protein n=1 Tax=Streptomyces sp. 2231.1 TaxID=1855347 RepID=UPI00089BF06A|nr:hypothetical protein [Streptomyces sp. 2231.1]SEE66538.1 hypothetical protein SAMN05216532_8245 [Streptomyces sp. 2231.1]